MIYSVIGELNREKSYPVGSLCSIAGIARSSYYKHKSRHVPQREKENAEITGLLSRLHAEVRGIYGYRRMTMNINRITCRRYNRKRIYRLMREAGISSVIRRKRKAYIKSTPAVTAQNLLGRQFTASGPNKKWLTDITEFKLTDGSKAYLSAILDLYDNSAVAYAMGHSSNNVLVNRTFDMASELNPGASPLVHSDRGYQYTNKDFKRRLDSMNATQSMSRVGKCIDNGPMEGFWGIIKSEMYYLRKFGSYEELRAAVEEYIDFYNTRRPQERLNGLAPMEFRNKTM